MSTKHQLQATGISITSNIFVQVISRGFTFFLGAIILKYLQSSALIGIINVRLALLYTTLQFLSREPFRRGCLAQMAMTNTKSLQRIVNTIWLSVLLCLTLTVPIASIWRMNTPSTEDLVGTTIADYQQAVLVVCFAVVIELLAEPCYIYAQAKMITDHNPRVEVYYLTLRCVLTASTVVYESSNERSDQPSNILTKIATCQLVASIVSVVYSYSRLYSKEKVLPSTFMPRPQATTFDQNCLSISSSFIAQTFLKQFLTEGERFIMTFFNVISLGEQGIYDVVNNLGSLTARLIFKPIEESAYTLFSQTVSRTDNLDIRKLYKVQENLTYFIKVMMLLSLIIFTFGYNLVPLIVLYGGEKLNNPLAFNLMRWQMFYTPFLAINGVTECFSFAIMNTTEIKKYNVHMIFFSLIFLISIRLTQPILGSASFVLASCLMMSSRILINIKRIMEYFMRHGSHFKIQETLPTLTTVISLSIVFTILSISGWYLLEITQPLTVILDLLLGGWCLIFISHVIMCHEDELLGFLSKLFGIKLLTNV